MYFSIFLYNSSKTLNHRLTHIRLMGGGPRTFPGGLNKWQWKRMHEKKARVKETRLLDQEKQVYQARVRSQIRSKLESSENPKNQLNYVPLSPKDHIKALADRFMKEGAEDLWNEADGHYVSPETKSGKCDKLITESSYPSSSFEARRFYSYLGNSYSGKLCSRFDKVGYSNRGILMNVHNVLNFSRPFSVDTMSTNINDMLSFTRKRSSLVGDGVPVSTISSKWPRFRGGELNSSDHEDDGFESSGNDAMKNVASSAALGKYDNKTKKRTPLKFLEDEDKSSHQVNHKGISERSMQDDDTEMNEKESIFSTKRFDECGVSSLTVQALTEAGYVQMTGVQKATLSACLEGQDVMVKARAGTGKSIAFLLPAIETVLKASSGSTDEQVSPIYVLILCPTRELASQISAEANVLLKHHDGIGVLSLIGGTRFKVDQRHLESHPCQIIVATPGRLLDHIENKSGISVRLMGLQMLVLDEADRLLDLGFRKDMEKIVDCLPRKRQSLLFSATLPKEVRRISQLVLKREHVYIDTLGLGGLETHSKVKQFYHVAPHDHHLEIVHHLLKNHASQVPDFKVIVFCATAMMTSLMYSLFREMKMNVREIHSKKPQLYCTRISQEFKESKGLVLITSDVSRGMNYPDITLVVQVGIPLDRGQYIHRLGRTGRQGKEGEGFLLLAPWELYFLDEIKDLPLEKCPLSYLEPDTNVKMGESMEKIDNTVKEAAYLSWLGYYNSINTIGRDKTSLVERANQFASSIGLEKPPALFRRTALKMGLKDIPGIRIRK